MAEDDLSDLTAAWDAATPPPDPEVRAAHLRLAQENFARLHAAPVAPAAPPRRFRAWFEMLTGRGGLTAATALAACGFLVLTPDGREIWRGAPIGMEPGFTETASTKRAPAGRQAAEEPVASEGAPASDDLTYAEAQAAPEAARSAPAPEAAQDEAGSVLEGETLSEPGIARELPMQDTSDFTATMAVPEGESSQAATDQPSARSALPNPSPPEPALTDEAPAAPTPAPEAATMAAPAEDVGDTSGDRTGGAVAAGAPEARLALPSSQVTAPNGPRDDASRSTDIAPPRDEFAEEEAAPTPAPSDVTAAPPSAAVESAQAAPSGPAAITAPSDAVPQGSFEEVREALRSGQRPSPDMVRIGELVAAVLPEPPLLGHGDGGVAPGVSVQPAPWAPGASLVIVTVGRPGPGVEGLATELDWNPAVVEATPLGATPEGGPLVHEVRPKSGATGPWGVLRLFWTEDGVARALEVPILGTEPPGPDAPLAAAVAGWGLLLRGELDPGAWSYEDAARLAENNLNETPPAAEIPDLIRLSARTSP